MVNCVGSVKIEAIGRICPALSYVTFQQAVKVDDCLIATWIDRELLLARMGCLPLDGPFKEGVERGDLRTARGLEDAILPEGAIWAHVLDAEPFAMTTMDDGFVFVLWNRGIYAFDKTGVEKWRHPLLNGQNLPIYL